MARGPKKHLKRLSAPKGWLLSKLGGIRKEKKKGPHRLSIIKLYIIQKLCN